MAISKAELSVDTQNVCPECGEIVDDNLGTHIRQEHGEAVLRRTVLTAKEQGLSDLEIGTRYGVSFNTLQQIITEAYGANINVLKNPKRIKSWVPKNFGEETTTVWSFKQRGSWATHDGRYRGNWSPYIPRNVILKYSNPGETVLDYFSGGGTTAVEAKLLGRRCLARDINPGAVGITLENLKFAPDRVAHNLEQLPLFSGREDSNFFEPEVSVGDARDLSDISDSSVDLICAHPPYAGIIKYSTGIPGDLSDLSVEDFLVDMKQIARESLRVLKPGRQCAILIGDARKSKHVIPIGFQTIRVFLDAGFTLRELVIKRQHNCRTTGFWYTNSIKYNFLLLAHEYLPIFEKPESAGGIHEQQILWGHSFPDSPTPQQAQPIEEEKLETTTVWVLPQERLEDAIRRNLLGRFAEPNGHLLEISFEEGQLLCHRYGIGDKPSVIYLTLPAKLQDEDAFARYRATIQDTTERLGKILMSEGFLVVETRDTRIDGTLWPVGLLVWEDLAERNDFAIKEIVVVVPESTPQRSSQLEGCLDITHRCLLIYRKK